MSKYAEAAIKAVALLKARLAGSPEQAWERATAELFGTRTSAQRKGCPRNAFLGLCEEGLIKGISAGCYTRSRANKRYALIAVRILREAPALANDRGQLWQKVIGGQQKVHNSQMDVVIALWRAGLIKSPGKSGSF